MTLSITQRILCELHTVGAMTEQTGLSGKDIADLLDTKHAPARLVDLRKQGFVKSSDRSTGAMRFWLTPAGETYAIELKHYASESSNDQANKANKASENPYNPTYEIMGSALIDDVVVNNVESFNRMDDLPSGSREIPPPQYNPDDVAFKKGDITESWYMVDGIDAQFETSSDAIAAAHDYVATHTMSTTVHIVASRKFAIIKPVVTTEFEYL